MAERYTRLFALPENLYAEGSPVLVAAGALLKDNEKGTVLAQLKFRNLNVEKISALKVQISCADPAGVAVGETEYRYLDLDAEQDEEFGQKTPVPLPDPSTRSYTVRVTEAVFEGGSVWQGTEAPWEPLPVPEKLGTLGDTELVKQYRLQFGEKCRVLPLAIRDLRICACGAIHRAGELCRSCGADAEKLLALDMAALKADKDRRLDEEAKAKAEADAKAAAKSAKTKKTLIIAAAAAVLCVCAALLTTKVIIPNSNCKANYKAAKALAEAGRYEEAITAFEAMNGYKDSDNQITICKTAIKDIRYEEAVDLMKAGKYEEAISAFEAMDGYKDSDNQITICKTAIKDIRYKEAVDLMKAGKYGEAITAFETLDGYKDSENQIESCKKNIKIGDTYTFGAYEQDNNTSNGKEAIEWTVLDKDGMSLLIVSKQALDCQPYNSDYAWVTWENCTLRTWMNGTFLNNAFSAEEQAQIQNTNVSADKNPNYNMNPGKATTDKVFLLSITEAEKYFSSDSARQCKPTKYAVAHRAYEKNSDNGNCGWWLRSPGYFRAAAVYSNGSVNYYGYAEDYGRVAVRPALWINLDS